MDRTSDVSSVAWSGERAERVASVREADRMRRICTCEYHKGFHTYCYTSCSCISDYMENAIQVEYFDGVARVLDQKKPKASHP